jgi:Ca-activated chloride channel family protein
MDWLHPTYGWALLTVVLMAGGFAWAAWQRRQARSRFGDRGLVAQLAAAAQPRRRIKAGLILLAATLLVVSLAGPRFGTTVRDVERKGVDLLIALDVSTSMQAEDVAPNRLERAKNEVRKLIDELSGDRVGLILFAGDAFIQCPLTTDYDAVRLFLDVADPSLIPTPGTDFEIAFETALRAFGSSSVQRVADGSPSSEAARSRAMLYISDGENHQGSIDYIMRTARQQNVRLYAAGVGEQDGARIPLYENGQQTGFQRDQNGQFVRTQLQEDVLTELAQDGAYFRIARTSSALMDLTASLDRLEQTAFGAEQFEEYEEQFQWPLALALLVLVADVFIGGRRP